MNTSVVYALLAAVLFGASTPVAKLLVGDVPPILLAGLLYLGSGVGLSTARLIRDRRWQPSGLAPAEWPWLLGAMFFGGVLGPVALLYGLVHSSGATASLLLNLEAVLTALLAWVAFKENADRRIVLGMLAIVAGGVLLSWPVGEARQDSWLGPLAISAACLCWAIDNNLTRHVSASDALFIAGSKGLVAGAVNTVLALALGMTLPGVATLIPAMTLGLLGYGVSLVLFVLALRGLGAARSGAYFSTAPFIGAAVALLFLGESASTSPSFWAAAALMGLGVWLHLTEQHGHQHRHDELQHAHSHRHDAHHQHPHDAGWAGEEPHSHPHRHLPITHSHRHFPDIHHRHEH